MHNFVAKQNQRGPINHYRTHPKAGNTIHDGHTQQKAMVAQPPSLSTSNYVLHNEATPQYGH